MFGLSRLRTVEIVVALLLTLAALLFVGLRVWADEVRDAWAKPGVGRSAAVETFYGHRE